MCKHQSQKSKWFFDRCLQAPRLTLGRLSSARSTLTRTRCSRPRPGPRMLTNGITWGNTAGPARTGSCKPAIGCNPEMSMSDALFFRNDVPEVAPSQHYFHMSTHMLVTLPVAVSRPPAGSWGRSTGRSRTFAPTSGTRDAHDSRSLSATSGGSGSTTALPNISWR